MIPCLVEVYSSARVYPATAPFPSFSLVPVMDRCRQERNIPRQPALPVFFIQTPLAYKLNR